MWGKRKTALITYHTKTGHTKQAAEDLARGLQSKGVKTIIKPIGKISREEFKDYGYIAVGSPTRNGKPARKVKKILKGLKKGDLKGKKATCFSAYAGFRGKRTVRKLRKLLKKKGAKVLQGIDVKAGTPLSLWKGPDVKEKDKIRLEKLGKKLAKA